MQRRRSTPRSRPDPNSSNSSNSNNIRYSRPSSPTAGIELREQPSHATSSSISRSFPGRIAASADHAVYLPPTYPAATRVPFSDTPFIMKPIVSAIQAWSCVVISVFAIVILSVLGLLFRSNHHEMVGGIDDPDNGPEVAVTIFVAVLVYAGFLVFCGLQGLMHLRENRRGAIALQ